MERGRPAIGIDLGTTNSCVAVWQHGQVEVIANDQGNRTTPSCVAFTEYGTLVGEAAMNQIASNPINTVYDVKRLIGRRFTDEPVQRDMKLWPFNVISCPHRDNKPSIVVTRKGMEKQFAPEQISSMVLQKMKETAEVYLNSVVEDAVITVPAYFNNSQRQATKDAAALAGLNVLRIINEPTAAAIAYDIQRKVVEQNNEARNVLVFDLGGGTFDVSVVVVGRGLYEVKAINGDTHLGGCDFDDIMVRSLINKFNLLINKDITPNPRVLAKLKAACEKGKRILNKADAIEIDIDCFHDGIDFTSNITRSRFELLNGNSFSRCIDLVEKCLKDAKMDKSDIDDVVLVGGSTHIPMVQNKLKDFFNGKELCIGLNPDEAVACGAAMQAAMLSGMQRHVHEPVFVLDITPLSIGTRLRGGAFDVVIPRNTHFPIKVEKIYTTVADNQKRMETLVFEGDSPIAEENTYLGGFMLSGIPPQPKGVPVVIDSFVIDHDGILTVTSTEVSTGNKNQTTIDKHSGRLTEQEISRMLMESISYKMEENELRAITAARTELENFVNKMWDIVSREGRRKLDPRSRKEMADAVVQTINWLDWNHYLEFDYIDKYHEKKAELKGVCDPIIAKMHQEDEEEDVVIIKKPKIEPL